ncbi:Aste57867_24493 [Aphanomyces stellatus]|uniref:Aste57867_24493 protein n=1 Tax=Aphanomyces stellatus TaxID=120398 RepID=A0A485LQH6_9STRA|nr:hypothetical protein As57867_024416 [Aphanomyces stellatus]VFU01132.1 Aste57867_24493 [Aphanomyces stellatus]
MHASASNMALMEGDSGSPSTNFMLLPTTSSSFPLTSIPDQPPHRKDRARRRSSKLPPGPVVWDQVCAELKARIRASLTATYQSVMALQGDCMIRLTADGTATGTKVDPAVLVHLELHHDNVTHALQAIVADTGAATDAFVDTLTRTLADEIDAQRGSVYDQVRAHKHATDDALKRSRLALKKEIQRFTGLETCLRKDEIRCLEEQHHARLQELRDEMAAKETAHVDVLLRQKSAFIDIERFNKTLEVALETAQAEIERLKKIEHQRYTNNTSMTTISESYVNSLRHAVAAANDHAETYDDDDGGVNDDHHMSRLRVDLEKQTRDKEALERIKLTLDESVVRLQQELKTGRDLLAESATELVSLKEMHMATAKELGDSQLAVDDCKIRLDTLGAELNAQVDLVLASDDYIAALKLEVESNRGQVEAILKERADAQAAWAAETAQLKQQHETNVQALAALQSQLALLGYDQATLAVFTPAVSHRSTTTPAAHSPRKHVPPPSSRHKAEHTTETLMQLLQRVKGPLDPDAATRLHELEMAVRAHVTSQLTYEFKRTFSKQLAMRMRQERFFVLQKIDGLVARAGLEERTAKRLLASSGRRASLRGVGPDATIPLRKLRATIGQAYDEMGVAEWNGHDVAALTKQVDALTAAAAAHEAEVADLEGKLEIQMLSLAEAELFQKERDMLLVELTKKYTDAKAALETHASTVACAVDEPEHVVVIRGPLQVQGGHLPHMASRRLPVSVGAYKQHNNQATRPMSAAVAKRTTERKARPATSRATTAAREHVRSAMKWELLGEREKETTPEHDDQPIENAWIGEAGMKKILDRRRAARQ